MVNYNGNESDEQAVSVKPPAVFYGDVLKMMTGGSQKESIGALEMFLAIWPDFALAHNDLGVLYFEEEEKEKALGHYEQAARLSPESVTFQKNLADFYYVEAGRVEEAMELYVKVLDINPKDIEVLLILGSICVSLEKSGDAKFFYEQVLELEPWNVDVRERLGELGKGLDDSLIGGFDDSGKYLVSAIVSTYNAERFIRGCLEDLEAQTFADRVEIIVVNSGSEQNEEAIVKEFQQKYSNIKYIKTDERETVYAAWNRGIKAATGKYITNANTDDRRYADSIEVLVNVLEENPDVVLAYGNFRVTDTENCIDGEANIIEEIVHPLYERGTLLRSCYPGPMPVWRKSVHDEFGYFNESFVSAGDREFWCRISQKYPMRHVKKNMGVYYRNPEGIESRNKRIGIVQLEAERIAGRYTKSFQVPWDNFRRIDFHIEDNFPETKRALQQLEGNGGGFHIHVQISSCDLGEYLWLRQKKNEGLVYELSLTQEGKRKFPSVAILMFTYDRLEYTREALHTLMKNTRYPFDLYIVDNYSTDGTRAWLEATRLEYSDRIKDIRYNSANEGLPGPTNDFWSRVDVDLLGKVDNDTLVPSGWLERLVEAHRKVPKLAVVGGYHFRPEDIDDKSACSKLYEHDGIKVLSDTHIGGCCYLMKKSIQKKFGPMKFNPALKIHGWTEYQHMLVGAGYIVGYLYPFIQLEYMDDPRSKKCLIDDKYQDYTRRIFRERGINFKSTDQIVNWMRREAQRVINQPVSMTSTFKSKNQQINKSYNELPERMVPKEIAPYDQNASKDTLVPNAMSFTGERAMPLAPNMDEVIMQEHWARYHRIAHLVKEKKVLDVACGTGYGSDFLAQTASLVTGGDISHETITYCKAHYYQKSNLRFDMMDIRKLPFVDNSFDLVVSFETLEHIVEGDQFLKEICRVLAEDGALVISTPFGGPCGNPYHVAYYQRESFEKYLLNYFKEVDLKFQRGTQIYATSISPGYAPTFTGEYGLAICWKPKNDFKKLTSIIILTHNQLEYTKKCIESIFTHTKEPFELIVVDNGSTDGTVEYLESEVGGWEKGIDDSLIGRLDDSGKGKGQRAEVRIIRNEENLGFAVGNNQGMAAATGDYILLMNNDIVVTSGWLEHLISCAERSPRIGIVGPMSNYVSGPQLVKDVTYNITTLDGLDDFGAEFSKKYAGKVERLMRVVGFCMLIKRAVINKIGGMDGRYGLGNFEDDDFSLRATLAGFESWIAEDCFIHHFGNRTFIGAKIDYRESLHKNWEIFKRKWGMPKDIPYGSYNVSDILKKGFILKKHYCPLPETDASAVSEMEGIPENNDAIMPEIVFKKKSKPDMVSIIIPVAGHPKHLKKCIENIKKHTPGAHEIIFVDNGCKAAMLKWIRQTVKRKSNYRLIKTGRESGIGRCFNMGMKASSGEYIVLLSDKVIVVDGWLDSMLKCIKSEDETGIVGPMTDSTAAGTQCVAGSGHVGIGQLERYAGAFREKNHSRRIPSCEIMSFCMLFRRSLVKQIGPLDEELGLGSESDDYCLRAALEGYKNLIAGDVFVLCGALLPKGNRRFFDHKWRNIDAKSHYGERLGVHNAITDAEKLYQREEVDKAIATLIDGIKYRPEEEAIYHRLAEMLIGCERFKEGIDAINSIPGDKGDSARTLELTGYCKAGLELHDEAVQCADRALSLNGASAPALNLMGVLAYGRGDKSASEDFFKRTIASDPGYGEVYTNLGVLEWEAGRKEGALETLEKGFILSPTVEDSRTAYLSAISETAGFERAEGVFREAKTLYPQNRGIVFLLIDILIRQEKYESAMQNIWEAMITFGINDAVLSAARAVLDRMDAQETKDIGGKPALSLCMIVKDEEDCLARCLLSATPVVDETVIVDTGSTDRTKEIAKAFGAKVYDFEWTDDFSEARNLSLSKATGEWILVLDADETISPLDYDALSPRL